jgi:carotenoid cleavage dioxygenase
VAKYPDLPIYKGFNMPGRYEGDILDLEVDGDIPADLDGAFYRVAPDPAFPPLHGTDIYFNGDGHISQFRFKNGRVNYRGRFAMTDKLKLERAAGRALFGAYRNPLTDDPSVKGKIRGTGNTNIVGFRDKVYALKEDSPALAMNADTLATYGYTDWDGQVSSETFTAHPKFDPVTGDMCCFGYAAKGLLTRDLAYYEIGAADGKKKREAWFELPYYCMMHDFGVTEDYAVFHVVPIVSSWERLEQGKPHFGFDTTMPIYLGILPRGDDGKGIRWFKSDNCFASHVMNAFNDGTKVYFDTPMSKNNMFPFFPDVHGAPFDPVAAEGRMTRWCVDMASNADTFESMEQLNGLVGEFPRIDDRYNAVPYRYGWMLATDLTKPWEVPGSATGRLGNTLGFMDHATGRTEGYWIGSTSTFQEPAFIPRPGSTAEGDGYIVVLVNRFTEMRSDLLLFDAMRIGEGPIATVKLPLRLRGGLHGNWVPGSLIDKAAA